jgi:hypothetical protein
MYSVEQNLLRIRHSVGSDTASGREREIIYQHSLRKRRRKREQSQVKKAQAEENEWRKMRDGAEQSSRMHLVESLSRSRHSVGSDTVQSKEENKRAEEKKKDTGKESSSRVVECGSLLIQRPFSDIVSGRESASRRERAGR